jgi:hypothetical protein
MAAEEASPADRVDPATDCRGYRVLMLVRATDAPIIVPEGRLRERKLRLLEICRSISLRIRLAMNRVATE